MHYGDLYKEHTQQHNAGAGKIAPQLGDRDCAILEMGKQNKDVSLDLHNFGQLIRTRFLGCCMQLLDKKSLISNKFFVTATRRHEC